LSDFTQGEAVKASAIVVKDRSKVEAVFVAASRLGPKDETGFDELVSRYSDDVESRSRGGRLGMIERSNRRLPAAVIDAAFALKQVGDVSKPVSTERGVFILRSSGRVPAQTRDLATVKGQIVQRIVADSKAQKMDVWTGTIRSKHKVVVFDDKLDQLDLTAPETSAVGMR
jgi:parvulin-like peptidyl-prolyl isomerase